MVPERRQGPRWKGTVRKQEDETLRNYWTKKKEKKKEREKKRRERRSVSGEAKSEDNEAKDKHEGNLLDSTKLTTLTSVDEGILHTSSTSEEMPSSSHYVRKCFLNIIDRNGDKCHQNVIERHAGNGGDRWFAEMKCYLMAIIQH